MKYNNCFSHNYNKNILIRDNFNDYSNMNVHFTKWCLESDCVLNSYITDIPNIIW